MHDIGNVEGYKGDKRIRGGGYWGIASDEVRDLAAWVDVAESRGFERVVLVGHSAGWSAARMYQAEKLDKRIVGLVSASGEISPETTVDSLLLAQALPLMAKGEGEDLIKIPDRSFPSYISAASFMDYTNFSPEQRDFFGFNTPNSAITRIECPILVFFGTNSDIGDEAELESLKSCIKKQPTLKSKVTTTMIKNADHMYGGEEGQVASVITKWMEDIQKKN
jgi:pimeloyl-ACP methyl ester carboxylesterase